VNILLFILTNVKFPIDTLQNNQPALLPAFLYPVADRHPPKNIVFLHSNHKKCWHQYKKTVTQEMEMKNYPVKKLMTGKRGPSLYIATMSLMEQSPLHA